LLAFRSILSRGELMSLWSEVWSDEVVYFEKTLRLLRRFETAHAALALPRRLMRVFRPVIEVTTLAMNHSRQNHSFRRSIAAELVGDDPRAVAVWWCARACERTGSRPVGPVSVAPEYQ
jgi:hypothetical protein